LFTPPGGVILTYRRRMSEFMSETPRLSGFAKYAWFALVYNVVVILWGVFLRASKSGDGCGQHWLTCQGEVIPTAPELKTIIEFSHRLTTGLSFFVVLVLVVWAFLRFPKGSLVRKAALISFIFIIVEALIGAGLVLTGNTAEALTAARPFWAIGHLINTFLLLAFLSLTVWLADNEHDVEFRIETNYLLLLVVGAVGMFLVGSSGSIAALSNMLFPSGTLSEGFGKDFSAASNMLLRLRISHPILSILTGVYLIFLAGWLKGKFANRPGVARWSNILSILVLAQVAFGAATLLTLAPIVMQIGHLLLADLVWISFVLMGANALTQNSTGSEQIINP
jgi:heme A synthase